MTLQPLTDKARIPDDALIHAALGDESFGWWVSLDRWLRETYAIVPIPQCGGAKYGWSFRYRKGGRPLCELTPAQGGFQVLVVLGAKEGALALECAQDFGPLVRGCLESARVFHDGRWLFIHVQSARDVEDIKQLVILKKPAPKKKSLA